MATERPKPEITLSDFPDSIDVGYNVDRFLRPQEITGTIEVTECVKTPETITLYGTLDKRTARRLAVRRMWNELQSRS